jgi:hypothetical protein
VSPALTLSVPAIHSSWSAELSGLSGLTGDDAAASAGEVTADHGAARKCRPEYHQSENHSRHDNQCLWRACAADMCGRRLPVLNRGGRDGRLGR